MSGKEDGLSVTEGGTTSCIITDVTIEFICVLKIFFVPQTLWLSIEKRREKREEEEKSPNRHLTARIVSTFPSVSGHSWAIIFRISSQLSDAITITPELFFVEYMSGPVCTIVSV